MQVALINTNRLQPPVAPIALDYIAEALQANGQQAEAIVQLQKALELGLDGSHRRTAQALLRVLGGRQ